MNNSLPPDNTRTITPKQFEDMLHIGGVGSTPMHTISDAVRQRVREGLDAGKIPPSQAAMYIPM